MTERGIFNLFSEPQLAPHTDGSGGGKERELQIEPEPITSYSLMEANHSDEAKDLLSEFDKNRRPNGMYLDWECPDARNWRILPTKTFYFHSIANGGDPRKLRTAANSELTRAITVVAHEPCGGRAAKNLQIIEGFYPESDDINGYVSNEIAHPSVLQAGIQALELSKLTDKEVTAMVRNHQDGELKVLAIFNRKDRGLISRVPLEWFTREAPQNPDQDHLLPYISPQELSEEWQQYMAEYDEKRKEVLRTDPEVLDRVRIQNPQAFALKTDLRAGELWMPRIAKPGTIFRLTVPRDRVETTPGKKKTILHPQDLRQAWRQAEYVVSHAIENRGISSEAPFRDTSTFIISTPDYALSQLIGFEFAQQPFADGWLADERNKVITLENNSGILNRAAEMRFRRRNGVVIAFEEVNPEVA